MEYDELHIGAEVYWNDPDEGICSGHRIVKSFTHVFNTGETIVVLTDEEGSVTEAFLTELT
jgi:hypothetical protein